MKPGHYYRNISGLPKSFHFKAFQKVSKNLDFSCPQKRLTAIYPLLFRKSQICFSWEALKIWVLKGLHMKQAQLRIVLAMGLALLPACFLKGDDGSSTPAEASLGAKGSFNDDDIRHLLTRTHFGVRLSEFDEVKSLGVRRYVDSMLAFDPLGSTVAEQNAELLLRNNSDPSGLEGKFPGANQIARWWISLMINSENPFQEVLAMFWHDHFATSSIVLDGSSRYWMVNHINIFREKGAGNLRELLIDVSRDPAMSVWLDNIVNTRNAPNENYAREFWELFTLGVDNGYTQIDIQLSSRAFTGYRSRFDNATGLSVLEFDPNRHDPLAKVILGVPILGQNVTDDMEAVVDITLGNRPVAEFLSRKLIEYFLYLDPSDAFVKSLASVLVKNNYELRPTLATLFKSNAFYSARSKEGLIKSPIDAAVGFFRTTGLRVDMTSDNIVTRFSAMGQLPSQPPNVNGWVQGPLLLFAQGMLEQANFYNFVITQRTFQQNNGINIANLLPAGDQSAGSVVDHMDFLFRLNLSASERSQLIDYLNSRTQSNGIILSDPFVATNTTHLDERFRGLLYIIAQHPNYLIK